MLVLFRSGGKAPTSGHGPVPAINLALIIFGVSPGSPVDFR
jgi:hypothetical protein